ncbi:tryptophan synthase subunit alpha [Methanohalophilus sp.]|uniref:tryptophan synthase subunit alpha n=1 Tax=Methanohalophilus sp. TaxID=1966352 RepID=UPI00260678E5|nr:tryptophan synthase subunit alpha [Methanohalophilus sp.]MDK2892046.1 tryptophan synthase alpha chain [Methanohalophilus sp.]
MKIADKFEELDNKNEAALITYICAGDPDIESTKDIVYALEKGGADIIELGLPFSDPVADGPIIQAASVRAIQNGMNTDSYFRLLEDIETDIPLVCMTYYNLVYARGIKDFVSDCAKSGVSGIIIPDLPVDEAGDLIRESQKKGIANIFMVTPNTPAYRIEKVSQNTTGFIYVVPRMGVTGNKSELGNSLKKQLDGIKSDKPKAVGFGISTKEQVEEAVNDGADGVIVGSALVNIIASGDNVLEKIESLTRDLKRGCLKKGIN